MSAMPTEEEIWLSFACNVAKNDLLQEKVLLPHPTSQRYMQFIHIYL